MTIERTASIIVQDWLQVKQDEVFYFITDENNIAEAHACLQQAEQLGAVVKLSVLPKEKIQDGKLLEEMRKIMSYANVIVGATTYSFITTDAVQYALQHGARFLSLPMATNTGASIFKDDFFNMDTKIAKKNAKRLIKLLKKANTLKTTTDAGTSITFSKRGRKPGFFNGVAAKSGILTSSSFEVFIPVVEDSAEGCVVIDGSLGYLGAVSAPVHIEFHNGKIIKIDDSPDGKRLAAYITSFNDDKMRAASEFGIGLNELSQCCGRSYIEDESAAGTIHIGLGRNLALGGAYDAKGHFDIVMHKPTVFADDTKIISNGSIII
ncbi:MAG: aminopeptidase [Treponema sp.]|nr:aminopeptidase [Treponema sp.]